MTVLIGVVVFLALAMLACSQVHVHRSSVDEYLNVCLDGRNQKSKPGPEDSLYQQCAPWRNRSCCTSDVSHDLHVTKNWLNFDMDHCKTQSDKCRKRFNQDNCFYECSPNVGPWLVEESKKHHNENFYEVPLCRDDCDAWWADCENEVTCLDNWSKGFDWSTGINKCPDNKPCKPYTDIYKNSTHFCETVWGQSFKVADKGEPCMTLYFDPARGNPNDAVARQYAGALVKKEQEIIVG